MDHRGKKLDDPRLLQHIRSMGMAQNASSRFSRDKASGIAEGFEHQRLLIVPEFRIRQVADLPLLRDLRVTRLGQFWKARQHLITRVKGAPEQIWIYCLAGRGEAEIGGHTHQIGAGDLLVLPARKPHRYFADKDLPWTILWFHVTGLRVTDYSDALGLDPVHPVLHAPAPDELQRAFEEIHDIALHGFTDADLLAVSTGFVRMVGMFRRYARPKNERARSSEGRMAAIVDAVQQRLFEPWTVGVMAKQAGMSQAHFSERFKIQTGMSPMAYVIHLRMQRAAAFLLSRDASVKEIAAEVGYDDAYYFSRLFRSVFGVSPRAYRMRMKEEDS